MNSIDLVLVLVAIGYAASGYVQGFVVNLAGMLGLLLAGVLAVTLVPWVFADSNRTLGTSLLALGMVVGIAALGQMFGTMIGSDVRQGIRSAPVRGLDALAGSVLGVVAVLIAGWALGYSVSGSQIPYLSEASRDSKVMRAVDSVMPEPATQLLQSFNRVIDDNLFPRYLDPFQREQIVDTGPPDTATLALPGVQAARASVLKVLGNAVCGQGIEGSGFVYAKERVMTNAHVVAGVRRPVVVTSRGQLDADVVLFDPNLDLAVLRVPGLTAAPLQFDTSARAGDDAAILGYPGNGPFDARAARIRQEMRLQSTTIYGSGEIIREAYSVRGLVRSGNSGGPLISVDGDVLGVIFAASVSDDTTGYALTASQAAKDAATGRFATSLVSTGTCA